LRKKIAYGSAVAVLAALAVSNPVVADAARRIGGEDIRNGSIGSADIKNKTIKAKDVAKDTLKSWDIADNHIRGKDIRDGSLTADDFQAGALPVTAYARVTGGATPALDEARSQKVTSVTRTAPGIYCLELASGVDRGVAVLTQVESAAGSGNQTAQPSGNCGVNGVQVTTEEQSVSGTNQLVSAPSNAVSFTVHVP
jgi:hypothetical protein